MLFLRKRLLRTFEIPLLLIVAVTVLEFVNAGLLGSSSPRYVFGALSVLLFHISSAKFSERLETAVYFIVFVFGLSFLQMGLHQAKLFNHSFIFLALGLGITTWFYAAISTGKR